MPLYPFLFSPSISTSLRPLCPYFPPAPLILLILSPLYSYQPFFCPTPLSLYPLNLSSPSSPTSPSYPSLSHYLSPSPQSPPNLNPSNPTFPAASTLYSLSLSPINSLPSPPFYPLLYSPPIYPYPSILTFLPLNPSPYSSLPLLLPYT